MPERSLLDYNKVLQPMYVYIRETRKGNRVYRYLVVEEYLGRGRRRTLLRLPAEEAARLLLELARRGIYSQAELEKVWCGGWDLNPRRPTPAGPKPAPFAWLGAESMELERSSVNRLQQDGGQQGAGLAATQGFLEWCLGRASEGTCRQYVRRIEEIIRGEAEPGKSRWHVTAWKRYARWRCEALGEEQWCREFRRWRSRKSRPDIYVPGDEEIRRALGAPEPWGTLYRLLLESGLRLREVVRIVGEIDSLRVVPLDGFVRVELAWYRGSKKAYWGYFLEKPPRLDVAYGAAEKIPQRLGTVPWKYVRKYVATKLVELECPEIAVDFIQGRAETSVLRRNYAQILAAADKCYRRYAQWLRREILEKLT